LKWSISTAADFESEPPPSSTQALSGLEGIVNRNDSEPQEAVNKDKRESVFDI
jgi:hypothetical protein